MDTLPPKQPLTGSGLCLCQPRRNCANPGRTWQYPAHPQLSLDREDTFPEPKLLPPRGRQHSTTLGQHLMNPLQKEVQAFHTSVHQGRAPNHSSGLGFSPSHCLQRHFSLFTCAPKVTKVPVTPDGCLRLTLGAFTACCWRQ